MKYFIFVILLWTFNSALATDKSSIERCYDEKAHLRVIEEGNAKKIEYKDDHAIVNECSSQAFDLAQKNIKDQELLSNLADLVFKKHTAIASLEIYLLLLKQNKSYCSNSNVLYAIEMGLSRPEDKYSKISQDIAFNECWPKSQDSVLKAMNNNVFALKNSCQQMIKKGALQGLRAKKCQNIK